MTSRNEEFILNSIVIGSNADVYGVLSGHMQQGHTLANNSHKLTIIAGFNPGARIPVL